MHWFQVWTRAQQYRRRRAAPPRRFKVDAPRPRRLHAGDERDTSIKLSPGARWRHWKPASQGGRVDRFRKKDCGSRHERLPRGRS